MRFVRALPLLLPCVLVVPSANGQEPPREAPAAPAEASVTPVPPETMARDGDGGIVVRAVRLQEPLELDGALDEEVYSTFRPAAGFVQQYPNHGEPATEDTEVWVFYDDRHLYVSVRVHDRTPDRIVANEMRRDNRNIWLNDNIIVSLDTFLDRRTGYWFQTNPLGAVRDALILDETTTNFDWRTVWDVRSTRVEGGWAAEFAIPFQSLRYGPGREQVWGINVHRADRGRNEFSLLSPVPSTFNRTGAFRMASAATLVGLEVPDASRNLEFRPYAISTLTTDRQAGVSNDVDASVGIDGSYGITSSLNLDLTYNTDFAQVEIDEQQVNLTRFSLLFPEKREFFLEGQGVFDFAGTGGGGRAGGADPTPILFFSRRIGLEGGSPVPIRGGGRVMGRTGPVSVGLLNIQTGSGELPGAEATNFSVARVRGDVFERSSIGLLVTNRRPTLDGAGSNRVLGADANLSPLEDLWLTGYYARSSAPPTGGERESYLARLQYDADRYGVRAERLEVGDGFAPEVGFLRRSDFRRHYVQGRISRRPASLELVRRLSLEASLDHYANSADVVETQREMAGFEVEFESSDVLSLDFTRNYEFLPDPFLVANRGAVPAGAYRFREVSVSFEAGPHRPVSGTVSASHGGFYTGRRTQVSYSGRTRFGGRFAVEPRISVDWVSLSEESFRVTLLGARPTLAITPRNFVSALIQHNSNTNALETNVRWRWEIEPGTVLYVVYTDARDTTDPRVEERLLNRAIAVKFTRLVRF